MKTAIITIVAAAALALLSACGGTTEKPEAPRTPNIAVNTQPANTAVNTNTAGNTLRRDADDAGEKDADDIRNANSANTNRPGVKKDGDNDHKANSNRKRLDDDDDDR